MSTAHAKSRDEAQNDLLPDREMLGDFINLMFKNADPDGYISLRSFTDKGSQEDKPIHIQAIRVGDVELLDIAFIRASQAATWHKPAVFCPPVATFKTTKTAKPDNLQEGIDLSTECDANPREARMKLEKPLARSGDRRRRKRRRMDQSANRRDRAEGSSTLAVKEADIDKGRHAMPRRPARSRRDLSAATPPTTQSFTRSGGRGVGTARAHHGLRRSSHPPTKTRSILPRRYGVCAERLGRSMTRLVTTSRRGMAVRAIPMPWLEPCPSSRMTILNGTSGTRSAWRTWAATGGSEIGALLFDKWSAKSRKYDKEKTEHRWENYGKSPPTKTGFGKLVKEARKHDPTFNAGPVIVAFEKINSDEPIWHVTIAGSNGRMTITDIRDLTRYQWFNEQCGKQLNRIFPLVKQDKWLHMLQDAMSKITVVEAEEDTTRGGEFRELLEEFLTNRPGGGGQRREDLLRGAPYEDEEQRRHYFTMKELAKFLERHGMKVNRKEVAEWIRSLGGEPVQLTVKNKRMKVWWVPSAAIDKTPVLDHTGVTGP